MRALAIFLSYIVLTFCANADERSATLLGVTVEDLTADDAARLGMESPHGVKITGCAADGPARKAGLKRGDVIVTVERIEIENKAEFEASLAAKEPGSQIRVSVRRGLREKRLALTFAADAQRAPEPERATESESPLQPLPAAAAEDRPILQLDTHGHQAIIRGLAFTPDCEFLISAGDDKVIRVWDWRAGRTVRTIRGQSEPGQEGKINALALSPNGRWLAAGGWMQSGCKEGCGDLRLYDFASGEQRATLKGHTNTVIGLAFSRDGKLLISGSSDSTAIIWNVEAQSIVSRLKGHRAEIYAVGFTPDGYRAVTGSFDQTLRLWRVADGSLLRAMEGHSDKVSSIAVSVRDGTIASGDISGEIRLWEGEGGTLVKTIANQGTAVGSLQFSPDGRALMSTCAYGRDCHDQIWNTESGNETATYRTGENIVIASAFSPDGRVVATGGREIHIWDPKTGDTKALLKGIGQAVYAVGFAPDSSEIAWGNTNGCGVKAVCPNQQTVLQSALRLPGANQALEPPRPVAGQDGWIRANPAFGAFTLQHRDSGAYGTAAVLDVAKDGARTGMFIERGSGDGYAHLSYTFSPDGAQILSGGRDGNLTAYALDGRKLGSFAGHEGDVTAQAASPDGRYLISGSTDQTVRLWNLQTREPIVTIFQGTDGEWAVWTPQGYYAGSQGAANIVGWQINKGYGKSAEYVPAGRLSRYLNRPDIVAKAIQLASAEEAARNLSGAASQLQDLLTQPTPHFRVLEPAANSFVRAAESTTVKIALDATPSAATRVRIDVNGRQLDDFLPGNGQEFEPGEHSFRVPLAIGKNTIAVSAQNEIGWSRVQDRTVTLDVPTPSPDLQGGRIHRESPGGKRKHPKQPENRGSRVQLLLAQ